MISGLLKDKITFLKCVILNDEYGSEKREWEEVEFHANLMFVTLHSLH